jgi:hypothetical protein
MGFAGLGKSLIITCCKCRLRARSAENVTAMKTLALVFAMIFAAGMAMRPVPARAQTGVSSDCIDRVSSDCVLVSRWWASECWKLPDAKFERCVARIERERHRMMGRFPWRKLKNEPNRDLVKALRTCWHSDTDECATLISENKGMFR